MLADMTSTSSITEFHDDALALIAGRLAELNRRSLAQAHPRACVLLSLCTKHGEPAFLFTKRSDLVGTHKGQVSFPGGHMDPTDADEVACALRELEEETHIAPASVRVLGHFHDVHSIHQVRVTPVVGFVGEMGDASSLDVSAEEVDIAFALSLQEVLAPDKREWQDLGPYRIPIFQAGPAPVWGLTAYLVMEFVQEVLQLKIE